MHFFSFYLQPLPDCHHFLLFGGFLFRLWCSPPLRFVDYFLSRSARTIFSFHSRLVVTAAVLYLFLLLVGICYAFYSCIHSFLAFFLPFLLKKCPFLLHISQKCCTFAACNPIYISIQTRKIYERYTINIR